MSYSSESAKYGRIPTVFVELDMDFCANVYGSSPCTAAIGVTGASKCYNTYATCQSKPNFNKTTKTYRFCEQNADLPVGLSAIPLLKSVSFASQEITPNKGLGVRGSVSISFIDAPWPDTEIDPYFSERTNQGTFWGKFKARNPFYENRVLRVRRGYLTKTGFNWANFVNSVYVIEQLQGIAKDDSVKIVAKDILKLADDKKALFPKPSNGRLSAAIDAIQTSFTLTPSGVGSQYKTSGKLAISGEMMSYTRSGDTFTVVRGVNNTQAEAHNVEDTVQEVGIFTGEKVHDVIYDLLTTYSGISTSYIDKPAWDAEATAYLAGVWSAEIPEPTGINTLIGELTEQGTCRVWWDELAQLIQFRAIKPLPLGLPVLSDESHFLTKSIDVKTDTNQRISTVLIYLAQKKPTEKLDDLKNYELRVATPNLEAISDFEYGSNIVKKIFSRWFNKNSLGRADALADALLKTYRDPPQIIEFNLTPVLQLKVGDLFYAQTRKIQSVTGELASVPMEVIFAQPTDRDDIKYKAQQVSTAIPIGNQKPVPFAIDEVVGVNLYDRFVSIWGIPESGDIITFTVFESVLITGATINDYAIVVDNRWPPGVTLLLVNKGVIAGRGANGVKGVDILDNIPLTFSAPLNGNNGGDALLVDCLVEIDNTSGVITGGGPSGGSGGAYYRNSPLPSGGVAGSGSGGGWPLGLGGGKGVSLVVNAVDGLDGGSAATLAGTGGAGALNGIFTGGKGGDGGKYIDAQNGSSAIGPGGGLASGIGNGGILGDAIHGNNLITWVNTGTIYGNILP